MKKILKIVLKICKNILIFILVTGITAAIAKNIYSKILINQFKSEGVYQPNLSTDDVKVYHVESDIDRDTIILKDDKITPGNTGDILISLHLPLDNELIAGVVSFFAGGHAGIVLGDYLDQKGATNNDFLLESTGFGDQTDSFVFDKNYWYDESVTPFNEVIGLRVDTTPSERSRVLAKAMALVGEPYNYTFFFNTKNTSYCTDIVGKAYSEIGVDLNKDKLTTSVYDLLISKETYISYYFYKDNKGIKHIYYLV